MPTTRSPSSGCRRARSDVRVTFADGRQVALEMQHSNVTDERWRMRHADYRRNNIVDVWLWHPDNRSHWVLVSEPTEPQIL